MNLEIQYLLERWRLWCKADNGMPKKPKNPLLKLRPKSNEITPLDDDEAEKVNQALKRLKQFHSEAHDVLMVRYRDGIFDDKKASEKLFMSKTQLAVKRSIALTYLSALLIS